MAEIEIDLKLPGQESLDINSPYSEVNANVNLPENFVATIETIESSQPISDIYLAGPQGPAGSIGPSGAPGPSGATGPQGPQGEAGSGIVNTGELDLRYYSINNPSGFITGVDLSSYVTSSVANSTYATITNLALTGSILSDSLASTNSSLQNNINLLSGSSVLVYGNQTIDGTKNFRNTVYIHDLYVTGTEFITTTQNNFVQSPYLLLNLTGGAVDGGIFFVTGAGLTGVNDLGPIIGFDHTDKFKFGISSRGSDLSTLNDIAAVQDITNYSGFVDNKYATIINLNSTGSQLQTQINNLYSSGFITGVDLSNYVTKTSGQFNDRPTVNGTGVLLSGEAANVDLSSTVQITGDQNISGIKNFYSRPTVNGTGVLLSGEAAGGGGVLEKRHDFVTGSPYDYSYCGTAPENSLESASVWDITRLSIDSAGLVAFNQSVTNYSWTGRYLAPYA
jgi:hypothetical protein